MCWHLNNANYNTHKSCTITNDVSNSKVSVTKFGRRFPNDTSHNVSIMASHQYKMEKVVCHRCQPSRNRAGNPAFLHISRIPAFLSERPAFLALF